MKRLQTAALIAALVAGCATALPLPPLPPYATEQSERDRATCLAGGGIWIETQERYTCRRVIEERT